MTQENFKLNYSPIAMPCPFAGGAGAALTPIQDVAGSDNDVNFTDGFPSVYSAPSDNNGKFVTRGQMNAIGNLASRNDFHRRCGGLNTFDTAFVAKIGGYPKNAVLDYIVENKIFKVISLVDNNTFNFLEQGVDNINWRALNQDDADVGEEIFYSSTNLGMDGSSILGTILAKKSGPIIVDSLLDEQEGETYESGYFTGHTGLSVAIKDLGTSISSSTDISFPVYSGTAVNWKNWKNIAGDYGFNMGTLQQLGSNSGVFSYLEKDHYYCLAVLSAGMRFSIISSSKTRVTEFTISGRIKILYA